MTGQQVFDNMVTSTTRTSTTKITWLNHIKKDDYELWKKDYIWEALHGQRYGQSFCNRFGIEDNHLYYNTGDIKWADDYIKETYIERT